MVKHTRNWSKVLFSPRKVNFGYYEGNTCPYAKLDPGIDKLRNHYVVYKEGDPRNGFCVLTSKDKLPKNSKILSGIEPTEVNNKMLFNGEHGIQYMVRRCTSCPRANIKPLFHVNKALEFQNHPATKNELIDGAVSERPVPLNPGCPECVEYYKTLN